MRVKEDNFVVACRSSQTFISKGCTVLLLFCYATFTSCILFLPLQLISRELGGLTSQMFVDDWLWYFKR